MSDTTTIWNPETGYGDWSLVGPVLQTGDDLVTAIVISLFTDRIANTDDVIPDGTNDPRGWVGDADSTVPIGSRLWLLQRVKATPQALKDAQAYIAEALQWLLDDGVVAKFDITCQWVNPTLLGATVVTYRQSGSQVALNFSWVWTNP